MKKFTCMNISVILLIVSFFTFYTQCEPSVDAAAHTKYTINRETIENELTRLNTLNLSCENRAIAEEKLNFMLLTEAERTSLVQASVQTSVSRSFFDFKSCDVPHFRQERDDYCGPATAKQTIHYLTDGVISPTQNALAGYIGWTDEYGSSTAKIQEWLEEQGFMYYRVDVNTLTMRDVVNYVATDLDAYDNPCFGAVAVTEEEKIDGVWPYDTEGHILNISGIYQYEPDYTRSELVFTDPFITWADTTNTTGKHIVSLRNYFSFRRYFLC